MKELLQTSCSPAGFASEKDGRRKNRKLFPPFVLSPLYCSFSFFDLDNIYIFIPILLYFHFF